MIRSILSGAMLLAAFGVAQADDMPGMPGMKVPAGGTSPSTKAYQDAMASMQKGMDFTYSNNPDRDFVSGMLPHHVGAVDMARVELRYGTDPQLRRLARAIVAAQDKEIALLREWQANHPVKTQ